MAWITAARWRQHAKVCLDVAARWHELALGTNDIAQRRKFDRNAEDNLRAAADAERWALAQEIRDQQETEDDAA